MGGGTDEHASSSPGDLYNPTISDVNSGSSTKWRYTPVGGVGGLSTLPKLDPVEDISNFEEDLAQSPSARPGTIIPMY